MTALAAPVETLACPTCRTTVGVYVMRREQPPRDGRTFAVFSRHLSAHYAPASPLRRLIMRITPWASAPICAGSHMVIGRAMIATGAVRSTEAAR